VIVFDGDGSLLMQLGSLATIAGARPRNSCTCCSRTACITPPGSQEIPGGLTVDFVTMAKGAGYHTTVQIGVARRIPAALPEDAHGGGPIFAESSPRSRPRRR
jgi:phosphonopyruvate decarboxylase